MSGYPTLRAVGASVSGTGTVSPVWPTHQTDDIGILIVATAGGQPVGDYPLGFTGMGPAVNVNTGVGSVRLTTYWRRATSSSEPAVSIGDSGDHQHALIITFRDCITSGDPFEGFATNSNPVAGTAATAGAVTTTGPFRLLVDILGIGLDQGGGATSAWTQAGARNLALLFDAGSASGTGDVLAVNTGTVAVAAALSATTATITSAVYGAISFALKPVSDFPAHPVASDVVLTAFSSSGTTSHVYNLPTYAIGEILLLIMSSNAGGTYTDPAGWNILYTQVNGASLKQRVYWRVADGSEGTTVTVTTSTGTRSQGYVYVITNHSGAVDGTTATGTSANPDPPALTPYWGTGTNLYIATDTFAALATPSAYPTNYDYFQLGTSSTGIASGNAVRYDSSPTTTEDPGTFTESSSNLYIAGTIAVRQSTSTFFTLDARIVGNDNAFQSNAFQDGSFQNPAPPVVLGFTLDAVLFKTQSASFTLDAVLFKTQSGSFTLDAILVRTASSSFTLDADLLATEAASFTLDAVLFKTIYRADNAFQDDSFQDDSFQAPNLGAATTFFLDAVITLSATLSFTLDAIILASPSASATLDAVLLATESGSFTLDAVIGTPGSVTTVYRADNAFAQSAFQFGAFQWPAYDNAFQPNAFQDGAFQWPALYQLGPGSGQPTTIHLDAYLRAKPGGTFGLSSVLLRGRSGSFALDAALLRGSTRTLDAVLKKNQTDFFTLNAVIAEIPPNPDGSGSWLALPSDQTGWQPTEVIFDGFLLFIPRHVFQPDSFQGGAFQDLSRVWQATTPGTTGSSSPDFTAAGPLSDGSVVWTLVPTWQPNHGYTQADLVQPNTNPNGFVFEGVDTFTSGSTEPVWQGPAAPPSGEQHPAVDVVIKLDGVDITADVIFNTCLFVMQVNGVPGTCSFRIRDLGHVYGPVTGRKLTLDIDGIRYFSGFATRITRVYGFDVDDTTHANQTERLFQVEGVDINVLLSKRVAYYKPAPEQGILRAPAAYRGKNRDEWAEGTSAKNTVTYLLNHYTDLIADGILVDVDGTELGSPNPDSGAAYSGAVTVQELMTDLNRLIQGIYYILPMDEGDGHAGVFLYTPTENATSPYYLTDKPPEDPFAVGVRRFAFLSDGTSLVNDALVWGAARGYSKITFGRVEDTESQTRHGRWQIGDFSQSMFRQATVDQRANSLVYGVGGGSRGALWDRIVTTATVYRPVFRLGDVVNLTSEAYTQDQDQPFTTGTGIPLQISLPIRKMAITFPTKDRAQFDLTLSREIDTPFNAFEFLFPKFGGFPGPPGIPNIPIPKPILDCRTPAPTKPGNILCYNVSEALQDTSPPDGLGTSAFGPVWSINYPLGTTEQVFVLSGVGQFRNNSTLNTDAGGATVELDFPLPLEGPFEAHALFELPAEKFNYATCALSFSVNTGFGWLGFSEIVHSFDPSLSRAAFGSVTYPLPASNGDVMLDLGVRTGADGNGQINATMDGISTGWIDTGESAASISSLRIIITQHNADSTIVLRGLTLSYSPTSGFNACAVDYTGAWYGQAYGPVTVGTGTGMAANYTLPYPFQAGTLRVTETSPDGLTTNEIVPSASDPELGTFTVIAQLGWTVKATWTLGPAPMIDSPDVGTIFARRISRRDDGTVTFGTLAGAPSSGHILGYDFLSGHWTEDQVYFQVYSPSVGGDLLTKVGISRYVGQPELANADIAWIIEEIHDDGIEVSDVGFNTANATTLLGETAIRTTASATGVPADFPLDGTPGQRAEFHLFMPGLDRRTFRLRLIPGEMATHDQFNNPQANSHPGDSLPSNWTAFGHLAVLGFADPAYASSTVQVPAIDPICIPLMTDSFMSEIIPPIFGTDYHTRVPYMPGTLSVTINDKPTPVIETGPDSFKIPEHVNPEDIIRVVYVPAEPPATSPGGGTPGSPPPSQTPPPPVPPAPNVPCVATFTGSGGDDSGALKSFLESHVGDSVCLAGTIRVASSVNVTIPYSGHTTQWTWESGARIVITTAGEAGIRVLNSWDLIINNPVIEGTQFLWVGVQDPNQTESGLEVYGGNRIVINDPYIHDTRGDGIYSGSGFGGVTPGNGCLGLTINRPVLFRNARNNITCNTGVMTVNGPGTLDNAGLMNIDLEPNYDADAATIYFRANNLRLTNHAIFSGVSGFSGMAMASCGATGLQRPLVEMINCSSDYFNFAAGNVGTLTLDISSDHIQDSSTQVYYHDIAHLNLIRTTNIFPIDYPYCG